MDTSLEQNEQVIEKQEKIASKIPLAIIDFLKSAGLALLFCAFVYVFIAMPNQIEGDSMTPNFHGGEIILTGKINQWLGNSDLGKSLGMDYRRGDVIVFQKPGFNDFIKRIVGMPGDKIAIKDGDIYIDDKKITESYLPNNPYTRSGSFLGDNDEAIQVPEGSYFVLGDNRTESHDSRYSDIGFVKREWMKGKVFFRYWPLNSFGLITTGEIE